MGVFSHPPTYHQLAEANDSPFRFRCLGYRCRLGHDSIHHAATSWGLDRTGPNWRERGRGWELWWKNPPGPNLFVVGVFLCSFCEAIFSWQFEAGQNDVVFCFVFKLVLEVRSTHLSFDQTNTSSFYSWEFLLFDGKRILLTTSMLIVNIPTIKKHGLQFDKCETPVKFLWGISGSSMILGWLALSKKSGARTRRWCVWKMPR